MLKNKYEIKSSNIKNNTPQEEPKNHHQHNSHNAHEPKTRGLNQSRIEKQSKTKNEKCIEHAPISNNENMLGIVSQHKANENTHSSKIYENAKNGDNMCPNNQTSQLIQFVLEQTDMKLVKQEMETLKTEIQKLSNQIMKLERKPNWIHGTEKWEENNKKQTKFGNIMNNNDNGYPSSIEMCVLDNYKINVTHNKLTEP